MTTPSQIPSQSALPNQNSNITPVNSGIPSQSALPQKNRVKAFSWQEDQEDYSCCSKYTSQIFDTAEEARDYDKKWIREKYLQKIPDHPPCCSEYFKFDQENPNDLFLLATGQLFATLVDAMNYAQKINKKIIKIEKRYEY